MASESPAALKSPRLLSLDAFRGLTILGMILVNNPGSWEPGERYAPLDHASWHGWTPTDWIFPLFLFIVGASLAYSLRKYREGTTIDPSVYTRIFRRTCALFLLGLFGALFGHLLDRLFEGADSLHLETLRWLGVLQRIALVYLAASLIVLHTGVKTQAAIALGLLLGYWGLLAGLPPGSDYQSRLSPEGNVVRAVDLRVIGQAHMYTQATTEKTEPEGLLSTLPAIANALLGYWTGLLIQRRGANWNTVAWLLVVGLIVVATGLAWGQIFPINKKLWTSSFVLLTSGVGMAGIGLCLGLVDVAGCRKLARPFEIVGANAIFVYVGSGLLAQLLEATRVDGQSTKAWLYETVFTDHLGNPKLASLAFAAATVAFWWLVLWGMSRRGWSIRV